MQEYIFISFPKKKYICVFIHSTHHYVTCILLLRNLSHNQSLSNNFLSFLIFTPCVCIYLEFWVYTKKRLSLVVFGQKKKKVSERRQQVRGRRLQAHCSLLRSVSKTTPKFTTKSHFPGGRACNVKAVEGRLRSAVQES